MPRLIFKWPIRSVSKAFSGNILRTKGKRSGSLTGESFQTLAGSSGLATFGYGGGSTAKSSSLQIVNALKLGHRNQASTLLYELYTVSHSQQNAEDVVSVLEYCARTPDPLFVMDTWRVLQERKVNLSRNCYMLIVQALFNGGHLEEAVQLVKYLSENHHVSYMLPVYTYLLSACAKMKDATYRDHCLNLMDHHLLGKNEHTYTALLKLAVLDENLFAVHEILREHCKYYSLNIISLRKFIWSFTRLKDLESAYKTLQYMISVALKEGTVLRRSVLGKIYCPHLDIPIPSRGAMGLIDFTLQQDGHTMPHVSNFVEIINSTNPLQQIPVNSNASVLKDHRKGPIKKVLRWSFNDIIHACAQCRRAELAIDSNKKIQIKKKYADLANKLFSQMQTLGLEPSSHTYDGLVKAIIPGIGDTIKLLEVMEEKDVKPYDSTLSVLSLSCSKALDLDLAEGLLSQITSCPNPHPYNEFLVACSITDQPERAIKMLVKMRDLKLKPNIKTYELLFSLFGNVNAPYEEGNLFSQSIVTQRINAILADMLENGIQHSHRSLRNLLRALGLEGMVQEMLQYLHRVEGQFSNNLVDTEVLNTVLHSLVEANEISEAIGIFKNMRLSGINPNVATYNIMIDCCSYFRCYKSACALVSLMLRHGYPPETLTYTALVKVLLDLDAFDQALNLLDQSITEGNKPDVLLFNTILSKASSSGRIDVIELVLGIMHQEKVQPDPSTCSYVFDAYVDREFFGTAIEALQVLSILMISPNYIGIEDMRRECERFILSDEPDAEMIIFRTFKHSMNLATGLLNLRWCSIVGSVIPWAPDQSPWSRRLGINSADPIKKQG